MKTQTSALLAGIGIGFVVAALTITDKRQGEEEDPAPQNLAANSRATEALLAEAVQLGHTTALTSAFSKLLRMAKEDPRKLIEFAFGN